MKRDAVYGAVAGAALAVMLTAALHACEWLSGAYPPVLRAATLPGDAIVFAYMRDSRPHWAIPVVGFAINTAIFVAAFALVAPHLLPRLRRSAR